MVRGQFLPFEPLMALRLIIEDDEGTTTIVPLGEDAITIGRQQGNTIQLTEKNVSRRHARLYPDGEGWVIEDLGSYNGIRVNGQPIEGRVVLSEGDVVQIGDYHLALTEDVDKRTLNFDGRDAANEGDPMLLVSSSSELQRLSQEEVAALQQSGPQLVPLTSSGLHDASRLTGGFPLPNADERSRSNGTGVLIAVGVVVALLSVAGATWFLYGNRTLSPELVLGGAGAQQAAQAYAPPPRPFGIASNDPAPEAAPPNAPPTTPDAVPPPAEAVREPGPSEAPHVRPPAAEREGVDAPPEQADEGEVVAEIDDEDAQEPAAKKRRRTATASAAKASPPLTAEVASVPEPPPAPPKPTGSEIDELLTEARKNQFQAPAKAYLVAQKAHSLANQAGDAKRSQDALFVMAHAACRRGEVADAKKAISKIRGGARDLAVGLCQKAGVEIIL